MTKQEKEEFRRLEHEIKQLKEIIMATRADLNTAITNLPAAIVAALPPQPGAEDFTPEITAINAVPAAVAALLATPATPAS
jgi:hypothetical protein